MLRDAVRPGPERRLPAKRPEILPDGLAPERERVVRLVLVQTSAQGRENIRPERLDDECDSGLVLALLEQRTHPSFECGPPIARFLGQWTPPERGDGNPARSRRGEFDGPKRSPVASHSGGDV